VVAQFDDQCASDGVEWNGIAQYGKVVHARIIVDFAGSYRAAFRVVALRLAEDARCR